MDIRSSSHSGIGKINEDYLACRHLPKGHTVAVLADGMGGLSHGNVAARIVVDTIIQTIEEHITTISPEELLPYSLTKANEAVRIKSTELHCKMGAAVAILMAADDKTYFSWLGNVRIYLAHKSELRQLTSDHILPADTKKLFLTRCVNGKDFRNNPPIRSIELIPPARIILCTDGFYQNLTPENMIELGADAARLITHASDDFSVIEMNY
jgi:serine/threonine protein phosphatase PrpC